MGEPPNRTRTPQRPEEPPQQFTRPVDLTPEEDFSPQAAVRRELSYQLDYSDTYRALNRKINEESLKDKRARELGINPAAAALPSYSMYQRQAEALISQESRRRGASPHFDDYPTVKKFIEDAEREGITFTSKEVKDAVHFGILNAAADRVVAATVASTPDRVAINNVYMTLQESNPLMAAILPEVVEEKLKEVITDPTIVQRFMAVAIKGLGTAFAPFIFLNEGAQHRYRAAQWNADQNANDPEFAWRHLLYGAFSNDALEATAGGSGSFNQEYINEIIASGEYSNLQIQIALDIAKAAADGDPDAIINVWQDKYADNEEAAPIIRDLIYRRADGNMQELMRQIDSA
jgi:hypothetical protein